MARTSFVFWALAASLIAGTQAFAASDYTSETTAIYNTWTMPGINISSPTGYGANWKQVFIGGGFVNRNRNSTGADGAMGLGFGLGDSAKYIGLETSVNIMDVSGFSRGGTSFKVHRQLPAGFGVSIGRENMFTWGTVGTNAQSTYGAVSKIFFMKDETKWFSALTLSAGVGNGRFRSAADERAGNNTVGFFATAAIRVQQPLAAIVDWSGQDLNLGLSITPLRKLPLFINPALVDVTGNAGDSARFSLGVGLAYAFI